MTLPRRLLDDASAAPWLAERVGAGSEPSALPAGARARVGDALAVRLQRERRWTALAWPAAGALVLASGVLALVMSGAPPAPAPGADGERARLRREPTAVRAVTAEPEPPAAPAAVAGSPAVEQRPKLRARPVKARATTKRTAPAPAWLLDARAALATDPQRTLALIRANRDAHAPVSPEVVELTILALDAQRAQQDERAGTQP